MSVQRVFIILLIILSYNKVYGETNNYEEVSKLLKKSSETTDSIKSLKCAFEALSIAKVEGDKLLIGKCYHYIGYVYQQNKDYPKSVENYLLAIKHYPVEEKVKKASCYLDICAPFMLLEDYSQAIEYSNRSLSLLYGEQNYDLKANVFYNLAVSYRKVGDLKTSQHFNGMLIKILFKVSDPDYRYLSWNLKGLNFMQLEMYDSAYNAFQKMTELDKSEKVKALGLVNQGKVLMQSGKLVRAYLLLEKSLMIKSECKGEAALHMANILIKLNNLNLAKYYLNVAALNDAPGHELIDIYMQFAQSLNSAGDEKSASFYIAHGEMLRHRLQRLTEESNNKTYIIRQEIVNAIRNVEQENTVDWVISQTDKALITGMIFLGFVLGVYMFLNHIRINRIQRIFKNLGDILE